MLTTTVRGVRYKATVTGSLSVLVDIADITAQSAGESASPSSYLYNERHCKPSAQLHVHVSMAMDAIADACHGYGCLPVIGIAIAMDACHSYS